MQDARIFINWFLRDLRGLAFLGVSLAIIIFSLSSVLALLFEIEPPQTQSEPRSRIQKILMVILLGPFVETLIIAALIRPFLRFDRLIISIALGIVLGIVHGMLKGFPGYFTIAGLSACVLVLHIGWVESGAWIGIKRSFTLHAMYNAVLVIGTYVFPE